MPTPTSVRQRARSEWADVLKDAWPSLDRHTKEHCVSPVNLNRWWPGTRPTDNELELRKEMQS